MTRIVDDDLLGRISRKQWELTRRVLEGSRPATDVLLGLQQIIEPNTSFGFDPEDLFLADPATQVMNMHVWNDANGWGIDQASFDVVVDAESVLPPGRGFVRPVLVPYLEGRDDLIRTIRELAVVAAAKQAEPYRPPWALWEHARDWWDRSALQERPVRLADPVVPHHKGLRWEVIDLAAGWFYSGAQLDTRLFTPPQRPAHAGVLAAAAHFPEWVASMNGVVVPYVAISGYRTYRGDEYDDIPVLEGVSGRTPQLQLDSFANWGSFQKFACPEVRDWKANA